MILFIRKIKTGKIEFNALKILRIACAFIITLAEQNICKIEIRKIKKIFLISNLIPLHRVQQCFLTQVFASRLPPNLYCRRTKVNVTS